MSKTLLLADDSVTIQKVVGISFANEDVRIVTVDNGDDAVIRAREIKPDIVVADVVMPGKSGYDVCAAIKGDPELRGIPVLLLTGTFETFDEDRAARVGADGHITKPFEAQALVELVNARLAGAAARHAGKPAAAGRATPAQAEPEPFDFLEPEQTTLPRQRGGSGQPVASAASHEAFAFEAEPIDARELETDEDDPLGLGNEATEARTTLLLEDDPLAEAETAPPVGFSARDFDGDELTRLVLPERRAEPEPRPAAAAPPVEAPPAGLGDPLDGVFDPVLGDDGSGPHARRDWDVDAASADVDDNFRTRVLDDDAPPASDAATPPGFAEPLFDDDLSVADEFDLPSPPPLAAEPAAAALPASAKAPPPPQVRSGDELPPQLRGQVHDTLEKVAWEAFGDLSERIVREAVQRIEQVAWDVIPRLAETLIREEIRKLKGED